MGIYKRDSPNWWMLLERPGQKPIRRSTGIPIKGRSAVQERQREQDALEVYRCALADLARAAFNLQPRARRAERPAVTFSTFVEDHFAKHPYIWHISTLRKAWKAKPLHTITAADFDTHREMREAAGISRGTIRHELYMLKAVFAKAVEKGVLEKSPLICYKLPKASKKPPLRRILTHAEETRLLSYLSPEDRAIFLVGQDALVRLGNILDLRWEDDQGSALVIVKSKTSAYAPPISSRLRAALDALAHAGEYMFPGRRSALGGMKCWQQVYRTALARAARQAGIPWGRVNGRTFHWSTRRTGASRMLSRGADFKKVQKIGNWASLQILLEIYAEAEDEGLADAVELVGAADRRLRLVHSQSRHTHADKKTS